VNDPVSSAETAAATEVHADISFLHPDGIPIFEHLPGRWEHTPKPTSDFDPPLTVRIGIGERRILDLAIKHPGARVFAFTNWSYRARDWQYESLGLGATEQAWLIRVRLRGPRVDETFTLLLIDNDQPNRPPMIYSQGIESLLREHPSLRRRTSS
jgi:hypothetical protein